jgi:hypothetical protein
MNSVRKDLTKETEGGKYQCLALAKTCREYDLPVCTAIPLEEAIGMLVADAMTGGRPTWGRYW